MFCSSDCRSVSPTATNVGMEGARRDWTVANFSKVSRTERRPAHLSVASVIRCSSSWMKLHGWGGGVVWGGMGAGGIMEGWGGGGIMEGWGGGGIREGWGGGGVREGWGGGGIMAGWEEVV